MTGHPAYRGTLTACRGCASTVKDASAPRGRPDPISDRRDPETRVALLSRANLIGSGVAWKCFNPRHIPMGRWRDGGPERSARVGTRMSMGRQCPSRSPSCVSRGVRTVAKFRPSACGPEPCRAYTSSCHAALVGLQFCELRATNFDRFVVTRDSLDGGE